MREFDQMTERDRFYAAAGTVGALALFCKRHLVEFDHRAREGFEKHLLGVGDHHDSEWTPCANAFRRITVSGGSGRHYPFLVFSGPASISVELSDELNGDVYVATGGQVGRPRKVVDMLDTRGRQSTK